MIEVLAGAVIVAAGFYLILLGVSCFVQPTFAARFLLGFASSASVHYLELALRALVGASLVHTAPALAYPTIFNTFGWVLIVTSLVLCVVPWRWHRRFAQQAVPHALRYIKLLGVSSFVLGIVMAWCVLQALVA